MPVVDVKSIKQKFNDSADYIIDKIIKYVQDKVKIIDFDYSDKLMCFVIWLNLNPEKLFYVLSKLEPIIFQEKILDEKNKTSSWDDLLLELQNCKNKDLIFQIALMDISYDLFNKLKEELPNGTDD